MKRLWVAALAAVAMTGAAEAQQFFRIGTGGTAGTYYPVGGMIANAVSQPGKIIVTAQASNGSVANVTAISGGALESGFTQADVATWAQTGTGVYEGKPKVADLRLIANLYPESVHLVARKGAGIKTVADLKGKQVITTEGTTADIFLHRALEKAGLDRKKDVTVVNAKMPDAVQAFIGGKVPAVALWVPFDLRVNESGKGAKEIDNAGNYPDAGVGDGWIANNDWYAKNQPTVKKISSFDTR